MRHAPLALFITLALVPPSFAQDTPSAPKTRRVAIVVHEGVELLDFAGPGEVFEAAARRSAPPGRPWFEVYTVAPGPGPVTSQRFLTVTPKYSIENAPQPDILVVPGGATNVILDDPKFMAWVSAVAPKTEIAFSVCTGAFVLARAGLLDGLEATSHYNAIEELRREAPKTRVVAGRRFVDNGRAVTTAGVSAGIDGALHVVARLLGRAAADATARYMEYDWRPEPSIAEGYSYLNPSLDARGKELQEAQIHRDKKDWAKAAAIYESLARKDPADGEAWYLLGLALHMSGDLDRAIPAHEKAATFPDRAQRALYNLGCAYALKGEKTRALDFLEKAVEAGWSNREWMTGDPDLESLRGDPRFEALASKLPED